MENKHGKSEVPFHGNYHQQRHFDTMLDNKEHLHKIRKSLTSSHIGPSNPRLCAR